MELDGLKMYVRVPILRHTVVQSSFVVNKKRNLLGKQFVFMGCNDRRFNTEWKSYFVVVGWKYWLSPD